MIYLTIINIALLALFVWEKWQSKMERDKLVNAIIAKDARELKDLEMDKPKEEKSKVVMPSLVPLDALSDEEHMRAIETDLEELMKPREEQDARG